MQKRALWGLGITDEDMELQMATCDKFLQTSRLDAWPCFTDVTRAYA